MEDRKGRREKRRREEGGGEEGVGEGLEREILTDKYFDFFSIFTQRWNARRKCSPLTAPSQKRSRVA